jgi:hypothetical protein
MMLITSPNSFGLHFSILFSCKSNIVNGMNMHVLIRFYNFAVKAAFFRYSESSLLVG